MKEIIPAKLIIDINEDGTFKNGLLQYQIGEDGIINRRKFYTMTVNAGIVVEEINKIITDTKTHTKKGEKII